MKKNIKIAVIGAGISGLAFSKYGKLQGLDIKIFEEKDDFGGIAKVKGVNKIPYHMIGGHCFNSKFDHVKRFVFDSVLPEDQWRKVKRHASILFKGHSIGYPIEYSIKEINEFDPALSLNIVKDYFSASKEPATNLADWFINNFGKTLAQEYFIPYNRKIWNIDPSEMTPDWVTDKLPMPNDAEVLQGLIGSGEDTMPHSSFYYPKSGTQNTFIDALADGANIQYNSKIEQIIKDAQNRFIIGDEVFDHIIYTAPLNKITEFIDITDNGAVQSIKDLKYNKVTTMLWESEATDDTWTYVPDKDCLFHRMIHIGNFIDSDKNYTISEAVGEVSYESMVESGQKLSQLLHPLDYNVSEHAYVVFDKNIEVSKTTIFNYFKDSHIHLLGRFGEWEYYNMDICIKRAIETVDEVMSL